MNDALDFIKLRKDVSLNLILFLITVSIMIFSIMAIIMMTIGMMAFGTMIVAIMLCSA